MTEETGYDNEQLKFREQHGGLVWDAVRSGAKLIELRRRDGWMARLFTSLSENQQDAMVEIEIAYRSIVGGIGMKTMNPMALSGKALANETERQAQRVSDYFTWGRELMRRRLSHAMAMAIIAEGMTCSQVDTNYRQRKGCAANNLREALDVFCRLRGWCNHQK